jgi:1-acyl-sn-glycerol-3-phosphate acyltransferase
MSRTGTVTRRLRTIPAVIVGLVVVLCLLPALGVVALLVDVVRWLVRRTPFMATRLVAFLTVYLTAEVVALTGLFAVWVGAGFGRHAGRLRSGTFAIQRAWANVQFLTVRAVFGLRFEVTGLDDVVTTPFLLFARHTSIVDNLLPARFVTRPHGTHVRYVMKAELLADPCLDVAGSRLPNLFVRRGAGDGERTAVRRLAETLGPDEAILIYPEGTRFTEEKRRAAGAWSGRANHGLGEIAATLRSVLPPRLGGALALLEGCAADVVVMAHRGLDGFARVADIWRGAMVRTQVDVRFWRVRRTDIPAGRSERAEWLFRLWRDLDDWVGAPGPTAVESS